MSNREDTFREFARTKAAPLHRSAYLLCGDWHLAHDLVQEALAKSYSHWRRVQQADSPDAYVMGILLNEVRRQWRRHDSAVLPITLAAEGIAPDTADEVVRHARLLQALLTLPFRQRATVVLRYLQGMTERETAVALGCSEGTVKSQTSRALASLRSYLDREETRIWTHSKPGSATTSSASRPASRSLRTSPPSSNGAGR
jgi:RNA polymerase sigma-70 factor (sigma-E family)